MKNPTKEIFRLVFSIALLSLITVIGSCKKEDGPPPDPTSVTDIDGNVYGVIRIGTQLWTIENLRTTRYRDGSAIVTGLSNTAWAGTTNGAYAIYGDDPSNNAIYGKLYNWHSINTGKLAPAGWHIPTRAEWETLVNYLGGSTMAGGKIKSTSPLWQAPNLGATNSSKFSALPSGWKAGTSGNYSLIGQSAYWWASSERNSGSGDYLRVDDDLAGTAVNGAEKGFGFAVRCIKD